MTTVQRRIRLSRILCALFTLAAVIETGVFARSLVTGDLLVAILSAVAVAGFAASAILNAFIIRYLRRLGRLS